MSIMYVQFTDSTKVKIGAVFSSPQNVDERPNYSEIDSDDERYIKFMKTAADNPFNVQSPAPEANQA